MSDPENKGKDKDPDPLLDDSASAGEPNPEKRSGRVSFDSRGNPIWEWQLDTGVYSRDVTTQSLKKLNLGDLSIAETAQHEKLSGLDESSRNRSGGGFNPYNKDGQPTGAPNAYDKARLLGNKFAPDKVPAPVGRKPSDMRKLNEWIKLKKKLSADKDGK